MRLIILLSMLVLLSACGSKYRDTTIELSAKSDFQPDRYLGLWYEIARFPVRFQEGCTATTADYGFLNADTVSVVNTCRSGSPDGPVEEISGEAKIVGPGRLKVSFDSVPFIRGDYVVLWVDDAYETAVVGTQSGRAGWILARTPEISSEARQAAEAALISNGYDISLLIDVPHG